MEELPRPKYGRPHLSPDGEKAIKVAGVWLAPHDHDLYGTVVSMMVSRNHMTAAGARRTLLMAGVRSMLASLEALEALEEVRGNGERSVA